MKTFAFLAIAIAALVVSCTTQARGNQLSDRVLASAVFISTTNDECSGIVIDQTHILTARHCLSSPLEFVEIGGKPQKYKQFGLITLSKNLDIALITILNSGHQSPATLAAVPIPVGGTTAMIGLSYDIKWAPALGFVMGTLTGIQYHGNQYLDTPFACIGCDEGMSGAGVFSSRGELSGMYVAQSVNYVRAYMVPLSDIKKFLK